jgi:hypothetical protein
MLRDVGEMYGEPIVTSPHHHALIPYKVFFSTPLLLSLKATDWFSLAIIAPKLC